MPGTPHYPQDVSDVVRTLQRQQQIARTTAQSRKAFDKIQAEGLTVVNDDGQEIAKFGYLGNIGPDAIYGMSVHRADGTEAMRMYSSASGANTFEALMDRKANFIFSDDGISGQGIAAPHIPYMPPQISGNANLVPTFWPRTTSGSFVTMLDCYNPALQPQLRVFAIGWTDASSTGEMQALINGTVLPGSLTTLPVNSAVALAGGGVYPVPGWASSVNFQDDMHFELQIRRTNASGNVYCQVFAFHGYGS